MTLTATGIAPDKNLLLSAIRGQSLYLRDDFGVIAGEKAGKGLIALKLEL